MMALPVNSPAGHELEQAAREIYTQLRTSQKVSGAAYARLRDALADIELERLDWANTLTLPTTPHYRKGDNR